MQHLRSRSEGPLVTATDDLQLANDRITKLESTNSQVSTHHRSRKMPSKPRKTPTSFGCSIASNECFLKTSVLAKGEMSKSYCGKHYWICKQCNVPFLMKHSQGSSSQESGGTGCGSESVGCRAEGCRECYEIAVTTAQQDMQYAVDA